MGVFDRQIATAQRLIEKYGQKVIWNSKLKADNAGQPWKPGQAADTPHEVSICFVPKTDRLSRQLIQALTGTEVKVGSLAGLMGVTDFTPSGDDYVTRDGKLLTIDTLDVLNPNGQIVLYTIEFKG